MRLSGKMPAMNSLTRYCSVTYALRDKFAKQVWSSQIFYCSEINLSLGELWIWHYGLPWSQNGVDNILSIILGGFLDKCNLYNSLYALPSIRLDRYRLIVMIMPKVTLEQMDVAYMTFYCWRLLQVRGIKVDGIDLEALGLEACI